MYVVHSNSEAQTEQFGRLIGEKLFHGGFIALSGQLGAGKTVFVRGIALGLKVRAHVCSPSFIIMNQYEGRLPLYHFDAYRLSSAEDMYALGYEEYFYGNGVCVVEWPNIVEEVLPGNRLDVEIIRVSDSERKMRVDTYSPEYDKIAKMAVQEYEASLS